MRAIVFFGLVTVFLAACSDSGAAGPANGVAQLSGTWRGTIDNAGTPLEMIFHIEQTDAGVSVTLDVPAQSAENLPVRSITREGRQVRMQAPLLGATYEGELSEDAGTISGTWEQNGAEVSLTLSRTDADQTAGLSRPQTPESHPYQTRDLTFTNTEADIEFGATVTWPSGDGPFPGVVLISGSGQQDRNHEIYGHQTFAVLADALTRAGYAVLRYDDRGVGESGGAQSLGEATTESFAQDARAAYERLAALAQVDAGRVGLAGLSEGGSIAPMVAALLRDASASGDPVSGERAVGPPAFLVLLGASAVPGDELMMAQTRAILEASGAGQAQIDAAADANRRIYDIVLSDISDEEAADRVRSVMEDLGVASRQIDAQVAALTSRWYRAFLRYNPAPLLGELTQPVLALYGELDTQVPADVNAPAMREALSAAPTDRNRVRVLDGVNHLLQPATTGSTAEYSQIEVTVAESVLEAITSWLDEVVE